MEVAIDVPRGSKGAEGEVGTAINVPPQMGLLFHPTTPALAAATISKIPLKPLPLLLLRPEFPPGS